MAKGSGNTRNSTPRNKATTAGDFGFKKLGNLGVSSSFGGVGVSYSHIPTSSQLQSYAEQYLATGKWNNWGSSGASDIAKAISRDLNKRGAYARFDGQYIRTIDGSSIRISKTKKGWVAKQTNEVGVNEGSQFKEALKYTSNLKKRK